MIYVSYFPRPVTTHRHYDRIWMLDNFETRLLSNKNEYFAIS